MDRSFLHFVTIHAFNRRTDGQLSVTPWRRDRQLSHR